MVCLANISHSDLDISPVLLVIVGITYLISFSNSFLESFSHVSFCSRNASASGICIRKYEAAVLQMQKMRGRIKEWQKLSFFFLVQLPQTKPWRRIKANCSSEALNWIEFKEELHSQELQLTDCTKWVWHEEFSHSEQKPGINNFDGNSHTEMNSSSN